MNQQDTTFSQQLAQQLRIRDLQGRWRRVSSLSLDEIRTTLETKRPTKYVKEII